MKKSSKYISIILIILFYIYLYFNFFQKINLTCRITKIKYLNNIPKIIFRTTKNLKASYLQVKKCSEKWLALNKDWTMVWYTDKDCNRFMEKYYYGKVYDSYKKLIPGAYKADLWRLCILYKFGGVYVDCYATPYVSIKEMVKGYDDLSFLSVLDPDISGGGIHNGFIISTRNHPFLKQAINDIVDNINKKYYGTNPLDITGPIALKKSINKVLSKNIKSNHKIGLNNYGKLSYYLFPLYYGFQNVYKDKIKILSKYFSFIFYLWRKLSDNKGYTKLWKRREVYIEIPAELS